MVNNGVDNNQYVNKDNDSKKIFTVLILVFSLMVCTTSATYAYFALTASNSTTITGNTATASLELSVTKATLGGTSSGSTKTNLLVPQKYSALGTAMGSSYKCVDGNGNDVCHVYTITVTNKSTARIKLNGTITFTGTSNKLVNLQWTKASSATASPSTAANSCVSNVSESDPYDADSSCTSFPIYDLVSTTPGTQCTISSGNCTDTAVLVASTGSVTYYVVVWINETGSAQYDSGTYSATVTFQGENGTGITSTITS